jgi:putative transposase
MRTRSAAPPTGSAALTGGNVRNGYRWRGWDTRAGSIELAVPKLREGSYFPDWLLERRRRAESALVSVVATSYLLGVSTRRMEKLVQTLGITRLSKSQVSEMAKDLDSQVEAFRTRPLDAGPYTFARRCDLHQARPIDCAGPSPGRRRTRVPRKRSSLRPA